jgi:hypothetical protein
MANIFLVLNSANHEYETEGVYNLSDERAYIQTRNGRQVSLITFVEVRQHKVVYLKINKLYFTNNIVTITTCFGSCHHQVIFAQLSGMEGGGGVPDDEISLSVLFCV